MKTLGNNDCSMFSNVTSIEFTKFQSLSHPSDMSLSYMNNPSVLGQLTLVSMLVACSLYVFCSSRSESPSSLTLSPSSSGMESSSSLLSLFRYNALSSGIALGMLDLIFTPDLLFFRVFVLNSILYREYSLSSCRTCRQTTSNIHQLRKVRT